VVGRASTHRCREQPIRGRSSPKASRRKLCRRSCCRAKSRSPGFWPPPPVSGRRRWARGAAASASAVRYRTRGPRTER